MRTQRIRSENDTFQVLRSLRDNRQKRAKRGEIFVESVAAVNALSATGRTARAVAFAAGRRLSGWAKDMMDGLAVDTAYELEPGLMADLSDRDEPSELIVIADRPSADVNDLSLSAAGHAAPPTYVVVDRPSNHGNLGSLLRSAEAFGVAAVITTGHGVDVYDPRVIRASLGACFYQTVVNEPSAARLVQWLSRFRSSAAEAIVLGTDSQGDLPLEEAELNRPLVVVFGNEATGLSATLRDVVDATVAVPIGGRVNSLNLACAASIVLYRACTSKSSS